MSLAFLVVNSLPYLFSFRVLRQSKLTVFERPPGRYGRGRVSFVDNRYRPSIPFTGVLRADKQSFKSLILIIITHCELYKSLSQLCNSYGTMFSIFIPSGNCPRQKLSSCEIPSTHMVDSCYFVSNTQRKSCESM